MAVRHLLSMMNLIGADAQMRHYASLDERLTSTEPVTKFVSVPRGHKRILIDTWVSRVIRPKDVGVADDRELGLSVKWNFLDTPPPGVQTVAAP